MKALKFSRGWLVTALLSGILVIVVSAAAAAAIETRTVSSFGRGLWWSASLITTVGFIGEPPETTSGAVLSAFLMIVGFLLLALVSASMAALFIREEERPREVRQEDADEALLAALGALERRIADLEAMLASRGDEPSPDRPPPPAGQ